MLERRQGWVELGRIVRWIQLGRIVQRRFERVDHELVLEQRLDVHDAVGMYRWRVSM